MNNFLKTVRCHISTLTPVHIGCGEDYYPTNYVIDEGFLHCFGEEGLLDALDINDKLRLAKLAEEQSDDGIKKLQAFIYARREQLKHHASHHVPISKELEKFYQLRIGSVSQHEGQGRRVNNKLEIARHAFNPYQNQPYFSGSALKGVIRTAILNDINQGKSFNLKLDKKGDAQRGENDRLQKRLLDYQAIADNPKKDLKGDPLRLLKVGDAHYQHPDNLSGLEIRFAVNRKNKQTKHQSQAEKKGLYQLLECIPANRSHSLSFDINFLADKNFNFRWNVDELAKACNDFYLPQLTQELELISKAQLNYSNDAWIKGLQTLLASEIGDALKTNKAFLLRIGQHSGAVSHTLEGVRHIKVTQGQGNKPKYLDKPTTIWLAGDNKDQQQGLLPFGWVLVEIENANLTETSKFLKQQAQADYQKQKAIEELKQQSIEFLQKQKIEREIKAKQQAEVKEKARLQKQAEAERQQKMATLSETQKQIFELQQQFENIDSDPELKNPNGKLRQQLTATIKQAADWSQEDKQDLLEVAKQLIAVWGLQKNKKVKQQLQSLQN